MDPTQLLPLLNTFQGPNGWLYAIVTLFGVQWAKVKYPNLFKWLPNFINPTPSPTPAPSPAPAPAPDSSNHPALDALLRLLGPKRSASALSASVQSLVAESSDSNAPRSGFAAAPLVVALAMSAMLALTVYALTPPKAAVAMPPAVALSPAEADKAEVPLGHRLLFQIARDKAVAQYARDKNVSRAEARKQIDRVKDDQIEAEAKKVGLFAKVKEVPVEGKLEDLLQWIVDHQELVIAIVKVILTILLALG